MREKLNHLETRRKTTLRTIIYILDAIVIVLSFVLAFVVHSTLHSSLALVKSPPEFHVYALVASFTLPLWLIIVPVFRLQQIFEQTWTKRRLAVQLIKHHLTGLTALSVILFVTQTVINRSLVAIIMICTFCLMYAVRTILTSRLRYEWSSGHGRQRIILFGNCSNEMLAFVDYVHSLPLPPLVAGRIGDDGPDDGTELPALLGKTADLEQILHDGHTDRILFFHPFHNPNDASAALRICETHGIPASFAIDLPRPGQAKPRVISLFDHPFITFNVAPKSPALKSIKHGFDLIAASIGLVLLSPLMMVVTIAILLTMGRPLFFTQERVGLFGRRFRMIKFRTMIKGAEKERDRLADQNEMDGPVFKIANDPRVTKLGRFLRRSSMDELPQLINILLGTMSLVGPRPLPVDEQQRILATHRRRLSMRPGITGLWQVSGRSDVDFERWMELDLRYIDQWSLSLDATILLKTVREVILRTGAK
ncbi:MAG: sugar transferase [Proteobacteria bacterium]|nr:sugar transferase [Pseudomonadota bacterium]